MPEASQDGADRLQKRRVEDWSRNWMFQYSEEEVRKVAKFLLRNIRCRTKKGPRVMQ